jgi:hypothetical protein
MDSRGTLKIEFTPEQWGQARLAITRQAPAMTLTLEVLEARVAPAGWLCGPLDHCPGVVKPHLGGWRATTIPFKEHHMAERSTLKIGLSPEQREQMRQAVGQEPPAFNLTAEVLEDRIAPMVIMPDPGNHGRRDLNNLFVGRWAETSC